VLSCSSLPTPKDSELVERIEEAGEGEDFFGSEHMAAGRSFVFVTGDSVVLRACGVIGPDEGPLDLLISLMISKAS
jgi:hypothetical protein